MRGATVNGLEATGEGKIAMKVEVRNLQRKIKVDSRIIKRLAKETLRRENRWPAEVSIVLVTDDYIKELNRQYRGIEEATDVLAFPMQEGEFSGLHPSLIGDVVISIERTKEQARKFKHPFEDELSLLTVHGILHLLGYDDSTIKDRKRMGNREKEILTGFSKINEPFWGITNK